MPLYDKYLDTYDSENVEDEEKRRRDYKRFKIIYNGDQGPKSNKKEETETKKLNKIKRPLWAKINKNDFDSLIQDVYSNLDNDKFKTTVNKKVYDLENAEKLLLIIGTQKISEEDAKKLYSNLITPDIIKLTNVKSKGKNKRNNILSVSDNLESVLKGGY